MANHQREDPDIHFVDQVVAQERLDEIAASVHLQIDAVTRFERFDLRNSVII
ncbi:hypothetical protein D3C87_1743480 [compost metagenome]